MAPFSVPPEGRAARRVGTVLAGKYEIESVLGVGGMATVYMAAHRNGRRVAIKVLHEELAIHKDVRARFVREGYAANAVAHPGAVLVFDDDVAEDGAAFLVMELLDGETLSDRCRSRGGKLPCREVLALAHQLLDVLAAAHDKGIVHRDVKPENLFLTTEGVLKVLDFGVARVRDDASGPLATVTGARIGTPAFMPPEQALGRSAEIDARTDIWAVGATMFALLAGRTVHTAGSAAELIVIAATTPPRSLGDIEPEVPAAVVAIVDRAVRFARDDRFAGAREMQRALEEAHLAAFGEPLTPRDVGPVPTPRLAVPRTEDERATAALRRQQTTLPAPDSASSSAKDAAVPPSPAERPGRAPAPMPAPLRADPTLSPATLRAVDSERSPALPGAKAAPSGGARGPRKAAIALGLAVLAAAACLILLWSVRPRSRGEPAGSGATTSANDRSAPAPGCTKNADCKGNEPSICRKADGACVALASDRCKVLASPGDVEDDATIWVGAMFPISVADPRDNGPRAGNAIELARRDFAEVTGGLLPAAPGGPKRPVAIVLCDDHEAPEPGAQHLVNDLRVPAILGFSRSKEVMELASSLFLPRGVLALAANTASSLRDIPGDPRLVFRVTTSSEMIAPAGSAVVSELIEPELRKARVVKAEEPIRVVMLRLANASGQGLADAFARLLRPNGKSVADNGPNVRQFVVPDANDENERLDADTVGRIATFLPHVVILVGPRNSVIPQIELAWPRAAAFRPRYLHSASNISDVFATLARSDPGLRRRYYGVDGTSASEVLTKYVLHYNEVFTPHMDAAEAVVAPYDAFYVLAYAAQALGTQPITGPALAGAIARISPPGEEIDVGPGGIYRALHALAAGRSIDLRGGATSLDFDPKTGDATADLSVYCLSPGSATEPSRSIESGVLYTARSQKLTGEMRCPQ